MLSKSLIHFFCCCCSHGQGCVPSLLFGLRPNYGRGNGSNGDLLRKDLCQHCCIQCPQQAITNPYLCWRLLNTPGQVWVSLLWGHYSFLLGPGAYKVLFVPSKSQFPQSCVHSGSSIVGLMAISSKKAYATPKSTAPRTLPLQQSTADPYLHRRHSNTVLSQSLWGL